MITDNKFLNKVKEFGLNSYEAKIWAALLSRGVSSAGELSEISNVPRSRAYDVLESLEKKGFVVMKVGKPIKYIAVSPEEAIDRVKKQLKVDVDRQTEVLDELKNDSVIEELNLLYTTGVDVVDPTDLTGTLKDRNNFYHNLNMMIKSAEESITIMTTATGLSRKADALKKTLTKANKKGVKIRIAAPITEVSKQGAKKLSEVAEIKHVDNIKSRFCLVDSKQLTFSLMDDEGVHDRFDTGIWVNTEFFASALEQMFENVWKSEAVPVNLRK